MSSRTLLRRGWALWCNSMQTCAPLCQQIAGACRWPGGLLSVCCLGQSWQIPISTRGWVPVFPMTLLHSNVVGGRVVEPTFPMMLLAVVVGLITRPAGLRCCGAMARQCSYTAALGCGMVGSGSRADVIAERMPGVGRCSATPRKAVCLCAGK